MKDKDQGSNKSNSSTKNSAGNSFNNESSIGSSRNYISGDSTPSSAAHQFPWIATDPKHDSKKSAKKENS